MNNGVTIVTDARTLGKPKMLALGVQHVFAMFGATITVPIMVNLFFLQATGEPITRGMTMAVTLFCAGGATLLFHAITQKKVPIFLGSSFAFLGGYATVANLNTGKFAGMGANEKVTYACGGVMVAGLLYVVLAAIVHLVGVERVMRFLPPVVTGPVIICIGLTLLPSAISNASLNWPLALIALITIIVLMVKGKGLMKTVPILMGIVVAYVVAIIMNACGLTNSDGSAILSFGSVAEASWVGLPAFQLPKFSWESTLTMATIAVASMMEHIGDTLAASATVGKDFISDPGLWKTLLGDGIGTIVASWFGGPANTSYGENIGTMEITGVHDPRVIRIAAVMAIIISMIPKFSNMIATMPASIIGGISILLYAMIAGVGARNMVEHKVDLKKGRNLIVFAMVMACGFGLKDGLTFSIGGVTITLTSLALASVVGIALNAALPGKDYDFGAPSGGDQNQEALV